MVLFTLLTLGGARDACKATMLDFDGEIRILADPGWNGENPDDVLFLEKYLGDVDMLVLSHSTPEYIGAYILLCIKFPMLVSAIPVYATVAVSQLARVSTVEFYRARGILGPVETALCEVSDVDEWYDKVVLVKFQQNMAMLENRLMLTAYNSGHTLGGAFWLISKRMEKVVYAPTWNHSKDSFLNSASFISPNGNPVASLVRPTTLITGSDLGSPMPHKRRADKFLQLVNATLANGGAVLLPVAISGRFLELLHLIDDHLLHLPGAAIPVYFLLYSGTKVLSYAANLLDWMSSQLIKEYEGIAAELRAYSQVPFEPSKVDLLADPRELIQLPGPKIVFASGLDFASGDLSAQAMQFLCQDEKSTLILTEKTSFASTNTLTASLYHEWYKLAAAKNGGAVEDGVPVPLEKVISMEEWAAEEELTGRELAAFKERVMSSRRQKLLEKVRDKKNKNILNEDDDDESSSDDAESSDEEKPEHPNTALTTPSATPAAPTGTVDVLKTHEMFVGDYITERLESNKPIDIRVTVKMKPKQAMFPNPIVRKRKFDDYGENRLTPQETLNNEVLQKNLDALYKPIRRVALKTIERLLVLQLKIRCGLSYVDLSGLVDLRSLVMIVSVLRPQNLVLLPDPTYAQGHDDTLNGRHLLQAAFEKQKSEQKSKIASDSLLSSTRFSALTTSHRGISKSQQSGMRVILAEQNRCEQVGGDGAGRHQEFEVRLDSQLDNTLKWQKLAGNYRITKVRGELSIYESQLTLNKQHPDSINSQFILKPVSTEGTAAHFGSEKPGFGSSLAIGNVRLPELKKNLMALNMDAEFKGEGVLVVNDEIAIKKVSMGAYQGEDTGDLVIDGQIGPLYYKVKNCIKEMLAFV
ncbi:hypothetical protein HF325_002789 [Metschnikowia pulcherrima]|uniref:Cleavage and polyadenylation specificity factor subunit 2 n=1 Tax=Metschnikowia pulcherrima TaxID=27326 RepID=A0A8H7GVZ0_9ASCO|nr:hypothetical protein HF325_002789 [Metschnikowia pulcherrima]